MPVIFVPVVVFLADKSDCSHSMHYERPLVHANVRIDSNRLICKGSVGGCMETL